MKTTLLLTGGISDRLSDWPARLSLRGGLAALAGSLATIRRATNLRLCLQPQHRVAARSRREHLLEYKFGPEKKQRKKEKKKPEPSSCIPAADGVPIAVVTVPPPPLTPQETALKLQQQQHPAAPRLSPPQPWEPSCPYHRPPRRRRSWTPSWRGTPRRTTRA